MRIEFARTGDRRWWSEGGASHWGFGMELTEFGTVRFEEPEETINEPQGVSVSFMFGPWALIFYSEAGHKAVVGSEHDRDLWKFFEVVRP